MQYESKYKQIADAVYAASKELFRTIGVNVERPQDLYVPQRSRILQDKAGICYCYTCSNWKEFDGSLWDIQDTINEVLFNQCRPGFSVPVVLKMEVIDNKLSLLVTTVNDEKALFELYSKVFHYRLIRVNLD